ncbi:class III lanthionine synthetase LanKC [Nonomuraea sp. B10E15]|uniref:class III lanthionine synthetase LanKC n=1 Tax=Nonomuraea sp. B10E15 TaxID=3153560 RepID=UPI00325DE34D
MFTISPDYRDIVSDILGDSWTIFRENSWYSCYGPRTRTVEQGWKIHVSSIPPHAEDVLRRVSRYCGDHDVAFKFALDPTILGLMNGKMWPRGGAGKFITIYPVDEAHFKQVLKDLHPELQEFRGPYVLSDRRYRDSRCLYYRYGGIKSTKKTGVGGVEVAVIRTPDGADYVDERNPYYVAPPWVSDPFGQDDSLDAPPQEIHLRAGRYRVTHAMAQTSRGGAYLADDTLTGERVVIKEARPGTNWIDGIGDAVEQLRREAHILQELDGSKVTPRYIDSFHEWENFFLVQEFVTGRPLSTLGRWHQPPHFLRDVEQHRGDFLLRSARLWRAALEAMERIHSLGYVVGDVSPSNIIVVDEELDSVRFIDLEGATRIGRPSSAMRTPGFASKDDQKGDPANVADDYYGLAAALLSRIISTSQLVTWSESTYERLIGSAALRLGIHAQVKPLIDVVAGRDRPDPAKIERLRVSLLEPKLSIDDRDGSSRAQQLDLREFRDRLQDGILKSLRYPERANIPVSPAAKQVFETNRYCVAYGAAGILRALPAGPGGELADWLGRQDLEAQVLSSGLYTGTAGIAWTFLDLERPGDAKELMELVRSRSTEVGGDVSLGSGAAGTGLTCLHFYERTGDERYLDHARQMAELAERGLRSQTVDNVIPGFTGGAPGIALFLLYLSIVDGDQRHAEIGREGLAKVLPHTVSIRDDDGLQALMDPASTGSPRMGPYWESGSAGLGTACLRYGVALDDQEMLDQARALAHGCANRWVLWPTLASGLAGLGMYLLDCAEFLPEEKSLWHGAAEKAAGVLTLYRVEYDGLLHMPGENLRTVSSDLFTGSAGALLFITRLLDGGGNRNFLPDYLIARGK